MKKTLEKGLGRTQGLFDLCTPGMRTSGAQASGTDGKNIWLMDYQSIPQHQMASVEETLKYLARWQADQMEELPKDGNIWYL